MKFLFIVQGEGRGHLTQAIALRDMLVKNGHEITKVMVGRSKGRELPQFFYEKIKTPVERFESPNFLPSPKNKRANVWKTIAYNVLRVPTYLNSVYEIRKQIAHSEADVVVNFYDMLVGFAYAIFPPKTPYVAVSHQYLFLHPEYKFPPEEKNSELQLLKLYTQITCINARKKYALSMGEMDEGSLPEGMTIVPPLLREEALNVSVTKGDYIHGYILNAGYASDVIEFQQSHPNVYMKFFWDKKDASDVEKVNDHLSFYRLNDELFLESMAGSKAYATTAGFESVCEAMYMGKPVLMVPTHIEQACNAYEASLVGAGIYSEKFDLERLLEYEKNYKENAAFKAWVQQSEVQWMKAFDSINQSPVRH